MLAWTACLYSSPLEVISGKLTRREIVVTARATGDVALTDKSVAVSSTTRQRVFSGIQPTGNFHLGNYLGAIRNCVGQQSEFDNIFCIVDFHALLQQTTKEPL